MVTSLTGFSEKEGAAEQQTVALAGIKLIQKETSLLSAECNALTICSLKEFTEAQNSLTQRAASAA